MDALNPQTHEDDIVPEPYVAPAIERRGSVRDPLVWTVASSPVVCL